MHFTMRFITLFLAAHFATNARGTEVCMDESPGECVGWHRGDQCISQWHSVGHKCRETCFFESINPRIFVSGVQSPTFLSREQLQHSTGRNTCALESNETSNITNASWIIQDPECSNIFYAVIENWWAPPAQKYLTPSPGVQKWRRTHNTISVEKASVVTKTETNSATEDKDSTDLIQRNCAPVHATIVDAFVAVSWLCGADKAAGEVVLHEKESLDKSISIKGKGGFHGAFVQGEYFYLPIFHEKKICWVAVASLAKDIDLADKDYKDKCVNLDAKPRHMVFKGNKAYVVCEPPKGNNIPYNNLYVYEISDGRLEEVERYCLSSQTERSGTECRTPDDDNQPGDYLSEVLVYKNYLYVSNRLGTYTHFKKNSTEVQKRSGIFALNLDDIPEEVKLPLRLNSQDNSVPLRVKTMAVDEQLGLLVATGQHDGYTRSWQLDSKSGNIKNKEPEDLHRMDVNQWNGPTFVGMFKTTADKGPGKGNSCGSTSSFRSAENEGGNGVTSIALVVSFCIVAAIAIAGGIYAFNQRKKQSKKHMKSEPHE